MNNVQIPRLEALQDLSDRYASDPYAHSLRVRKRFREQKKLDKAQEAADERIKDAYGLPEELPLTAESEESKARAKEQWDQARHAHEERESVKRRKIGAETTIVPRTASTSRTRSIDSTGKSRNDPVSSLRAKILGNTAKQSGSSSGGLSRMKPPDSSLRGSLIRRT